MNLKRSPFSILNKESREIESYKDPEDEDKIDTIQAQDVLMLESISI